MIEYHIVRMSSYISSVLFRANCNHACGRGSQSMVQYLRILLAKNLISKYKGKYG